jgi:hypothetical protein
LTNGAKSGIMHETGEKMSRDLYYEDIIDGDRESGMIFSSTFHLATNDELEASRKFHKEKHKCDKTIFYDIEGLMYNQRNCGICDRLIGFI